jgi:hypothetical protein
MSSSAVRFCTLLGEAKDAQAKTVGVYMDLLSALNDYIEILPKDAAEKVMEEQKVLADVVETEKKQANILNLMHVLHCEGP